jgi:hypothetical protein
MEVADDMLLLLRFRMYTQTPRMARRRQTSVNIEKKACLYFGVAKKWSKITFELNWT